MEVGPPVGLKTAFAANPDPAESDPAKLDQGGAAGRRARLEIPLRQRLARPGRRTRATVGRRGELHRPMLWAVLTLLLVESVLAWRFGHHR